MKGKLLIKSLLSGGIRMMSKDRKITLLNDLESRLGLALEQQLPVVKNMLFYSK